MKKDLIHSLTQNFEAHANHTEGRIEFWLARDLQHLLGYSKWDNFLNVVSKAKTACDVSGHAIPDHFADVGKMVDLGSGSQREVDDIMLTRYACYLVAQNGDPRKQEIAFAQTYFALQARRAELIEQRLLEAERVQARRKLTETEKELSGVIYQQTGGNQDFAMIPQQGRPRAVRSQHAGHEAALAGARQPPLADFAPTLILKAKDFATEITIHNARERRMRSESAISQEHVSNNQAVRKTLLGRGIMPEDLSPEEDVRKVERRLAAEDKKALKKPEALDD
jgi:DNA-damage-inducible protein D